MSFPILRETLKLQREQVAKEEGAEWKGYRSALDWVLWLTEYGENLIKANQTLTSQVHLEVVKENKAY